MTGVVCGRCGGISWITTMKYKISLAGSSFPRMNWTDACLYLHRMHGRMHGRDISFLACSLAHENSALHNP